MIDLIIKAAVAIGGAILVDAGVKEITGKHIHEHIGDFVRALWSRLKNWAQRYLQVHANARKVYVSLVSIAAAWKRAINERRGAVRVKVFHQTVDSDKGKVISYEDVPLNEMNGFVAQAKAGPVLAMRH